jgi:hypothetical protein
VADPTDRPAGGRPGRVRRLARAAAFGLTSGPARSAALAAFLVRGGIVLLALPSLVLPSVIDVAGATGVDAITIAGQPTAWLIALIVGGVLAGLAWLAVSSWLGAVTDVWLVSMALTSPRGRLELPDSALILRLICIRLVCMVPLLVALAWAATQIFDATYSELLTPTDLATPLPIRVVVAAAGAVAIVAAVWLVTETVAAIAVRRQVLAGGGVWRSLGGAAGEIVTRPASTLLTAVAAYASSAAAIALAVVATSVAFDWCRIAARNQSPIAIQVGIGSFSATKDFRPIAFALAVVALGLAWLAALVLSAATSAGRSAAFTSEVADALGLDSAASRQELGERRLGLSGAAPERSGD